MYELYVTDEEGELIRVDIQVVDINDNPPLLERPLYRTQITEEDDRNLPKRVLQVAAIDGDKDRPENIVYFLSGPGIDPDNAANSNFYINKQTGEIFVRKPLDRDEPSGRPQWRFTVFAQDEGGEGLVGYADIQINLKDINDNAPIFPQPIYFGNITENGTAGLEVMKMTAVDYDDPEEGLNAVLVYSIEKNVIEEETGSPIFRIDPETGVISTAICCLDREKTPDYLIQVVAMDGGGLKGTGTASIRVEDVNDMPPIFTKQEWIAEVDEMDGDSMPKNERPVLTVTVHDEDEFNMFHYKVIDGSGFGADKFMMVRNPDGTGSLKIKDPLDYEDPLQRTGFRFMIEVSDKTDESDEKFHTAQSRVVVKLRDINDNTPQFERSEMEVSVKENATVGRFLGRLHATDPDEGGNTKVTYSIDRSTDPKRQFRIDKEGTVTIQRKLDREKSTKHEIKVLATDNGMPRRTGSATMTIFVEDVNDNAPEWLEDYQPVVYENASPQKIITVKAKDADDYNKGNGQPFKFRLDQNADVAIKKLFKLDYNHTSGHAILSSLQMMDREEQKIYFVPVIISDSGVPPMSATRTLTVTIGDVNDNTMEQGSKKIVVYNYKGQTSDVEIGTVFTQDADDWDFEDKLFTWHGHGNPRFILDDDTGMIRMRPNTPAGQYNLNFFVSDLKHEQNEVMANITVTVKLISHQTVAQSGSIRISGLSDIDFIKIWDYKTKTTARSYLDKFQEKVGKLLNVDKKKLEVFNVQSFYYKEVQYTDVRFSLPNTSFMSSIKINGLLLMHREEIESFVGINITMIGIDECLYEGRYCDGSCTNMMNISNSLHLVNANQTALVGPRVTLRAECICAARNFTRDESCQNFPCYNGGQCLKTRSGISCWCPEGDLGPRCQQRTRSFHGNGWAWYAPLEVCAESHLSLEFITTTADGQLLYNGPITSPEMEEVIISDFISIELEQGYPRLLLDFGSGTLELKVKTKKKLDDGEWHRLDVLWDAEIARLIVDNCQSADITEMEDGSPADFDSSHCQSQGNIPPFNELLNVNTPLQIGGMYIQPFNSSHFGWSGVPGGVGFEGCIRNIYHNSKLYDLAQDASHIVGGSMPGCPRVDELCSIDATTRHCQYCAASFSSAQCHCLPGYHGPTCTLPTIPTTFAAQSYIKFTLSFEPDQFSTQLQLRFRTRESSGELFRISDQHNREYAILEIVNKNLHFYFNLDSFRPNIKDVWLNAVDVNDGQWHVVKVSRFGSTATIELDGGEGRRYNETFCFEGHQWLLADKQEGIFAGGKPEYSGMHSFVVVSDFQKGCIDDVRLEGKLLPLPPHNNGTKWAQAPTAHNVQQHCPSNKPCVNIDCPEPFQCVDLWNDYGCMCGNGQTISQDGKGCVDRNKCLDQPCLNGGICVNQDSQLHYRCICPTTNWGDNCEYSNQNQTLKLGAGAIFTILVSIIIIAFLALLLVMCSRRRVGQLKYTGPDVDVRENIIKYNDDGEGEEDMTASTKLQRCTKQLTDASEVIQLQPLELGTTIMNHKEELDSDPSAPPFDDLRNYAYEGGSTAAGSLSSLTTDFEASNDVTIISDLGPKFLKLASLSSEKMSDAEKR